MSITDIPEYAHLSASDVEALGAELDAIRRDIESDRGERDARYIRRTIALHRTLEVTGRLAMLYADKRAGWWSAAALLGVGKIIENMEIGHNVMHGQWDWMNDPEVHSTSWEWDNTGPSAHWKHTHNYIHHKYTNVLGMDDDVGYGLLRVTRDQRWRPFYLGNLVYNTLLALGFQYGVAIQHLELGKVAAGRHDKEKFAADLKMVGAKVGRQAGKDYLLFPGLVLAARRDGHAAGNAVTASLAANIIRNVWTNAVIFCGHFPDGAEKFTKQDIDSETQGEWYLRQMLGSANFHAGPVLRFLSGNLSHQIEHHAFPDLPSNRYEEIAVRLRQLCDKYDLPYTTGPFLAQYAKTWRTIAKLSLPDKYLTATRDDAPETASEKRFGAGPLRGVIDPVTGKRSGLRSAIARRRKARL